MTREVLAVLLVHSMAASDPAARAAADPPPIRLIQTIPLPGVQGRIDHLAVDVAGQRLFVAALGNNTVEVVDLKKGQRVHSVAGFKEPQGLAYIPETNTVAVANGGDGIVSFLERSRRQRPTAMRTTSSTTSRGSDSAAASGPGR
jgi:DNA-binding beta-propeller fold protein YncE